MRLNRSLSFETRRIYFVPRFDLVLAENIVVLLNLNILKSKYENGKGCLLKQYFLVASVCHVINDLIIGMNRLIKVYSDCDSGNELKFLF